MEKILKDLVTLTGLGKKDFQTLQDASPTTQLWVEEFVTIFYDSLYGYESTSHVFQSDERTAREKTLRDWYLEVVGGQLEHHGFWQHQWFVGLVHIPRKVTNTFMLSMMSKVQQHFLQKCVEAFESGEAIAVYTSFKRVTDVIAGLIAEGYFSNYILAMEQVAGLRPALVERMMSIEVGKMIAEARSKMLQPA